MAWYPCNHCNRQGRILRKGKMPLMCWECGGEGYKKKYEFTEGQLMTFLLAIFLLLLLAAEFFIIFRW